MRRLLNARSVLQAELVRGVLEAAGIPAAIEPITPLGTYGRIHCFATGADVYVLRDEDYDTAVGIALQYGHQPSHCENCGYDLTGLPEPRCPECGMPFDRPAQREAWTCSNCDEKIEGQFTHCWKCEAGKSEPTAVMMANGISNNDRPQISRVPHELPEAFSYASASQADWDIWNWTLFGVAIILPFSIETIIIVAVHSSGLSLNTDAWALSASASAFPILLLRTTWSVRMFFLLFLIPFLAIMQTPYALLFAGCVYGEWL